MFQSNANENYWPEIQGKSASRFTVAILCGAMMAFTFLPKASADDWDKKTAVTFDHTVEIPGRALAAGTYVFMIQRNSLGNSHTVQVFDITNRLIATLNATPVYLDAWSYTPEHPAIQFEERTAPEPEAVKIFRRPGDIVGQEFNYPKNQMQLLAKNSRWAIATTEEPLVAEATPPAAPAAAGPAEPAEAPAVTPAEPPATEAAPATPPEPQQAQPAPSETPSAPAEAPAELPKTGSELPLIGMAGSFSLVLGSFLSAYRRRTRG
jgi:LPXTG-motif cell wall-anchored protein